MKYQEFEKLKKVLEVGPLSEKESAEEVKEEKLVTAARQEATKVKLAAKVAEEELRSVED